MRIGNVEIPSRLALAPMAGVTDAAFRQICAEMGAGLTCTELISSKALCYHDKKTFTLLRQFQMCIRDSCISALPWGRRLSPCCW